jgi:hypothetical protein
VVGIVDVQSTGKFSTRDFHFPFLLQEKGRKGGFLMVWVYFGLAVIVLPHHQLRSLRRNRNGTVTGT